MGQPQPQQLGALMDAIKARLQSFGVEGLALPTYKQAGCGQAAFPYLEAIVVFSFVMFAWGKESASGAVATCLSSRVRVRLNRSDGR